MEPADQAKLYQWDYDGAYDPKTSTKRSPHTETFSLGVFQWLPTANGKSLKRGPVKWRARGHVSNPEPVHEAARRKVTQLNARAKQLDAQELSAAQRLPKPKTRHKGE